MSSPPSRLPRPVRRLAARCLQPGLILALLLGLAACGDDPAPTPHGLKVSSPVSKPHGAPVDVGFEVSNGDAFLGTFTYRTRLWQRSVVQGESEVKEASATVVFELAQTFSVPGAGRLPRSSLRLRFTEADGPMAEPTLARPPVTGTLEHEASGRAVTTTLRLDGGTQTQRAEITAMIGGLPLAGFGASPSWLPDRPVRAGEVWPVEGFIRPRGMDQAIQQARQIGLEAPRPTLDGTIRVVAIHDTPEGQQVELEIDARIEIEGEIRQGRERGQMSFAHRVEGTAFVSAKTGLPVRLSAKETQRNNVRSGGRQVERRLTNEYEGTIRSTR